MPVRPQSHVSSLPVTLGSVAQPGRALASHARGRGFNSHQIHLLQEGDGMAKQARVRPSWGKLTRKKMLHQNKQATRALQKKGRESLGKLEGSGK
jgi:hypothetical protein